MSKIIFNKEQIEKLLNNSNVSKCGNGAITYNKEFKVEAVKRYLNEDMSPRQIFTEAGFDLDVIGKGKPKEQIRRWVKIFKKKGNMGLTIETRGRGGGRPKSIRDLTEKEKIKRLELEILYLKAENDFLAKLRAKRSE